MTRLLHELGARYADLLAEHHRRLRGVWARHDGVEVDTAGDAFFVAFTGAAEAVAAAADAHAVLRDMPISVRIGMHTGEATVTETGYVGADVHLAARISAAAHGGQVVLSRATLERAGCAARDLGDHRLKDFDAAISLFQLGDDEFPPLRTVGATNLPRPASTFVGRTRELGELVALVRGGTRLVTLTGPGGSGKTRLAIEAAGELVPEFPHGVFWVPLAAVRDPELVLETVAQTLGAKAPLPTHLAGKRALVLLDNLEQVVDAAADIAQIVSATPGLTVLVTSRELLRVDGETRFSVAPLAEEEAVSLFCERGRVPPGDVVDELCRRLDHLPLAIELAAARASALSSEQILERLGRGLDELTGRRDAAPRHATLRATIAWSHDLLDATERELFARLAVFDGGCTLETAEEVCEADPATLVSLLDKSLLRRTGDRFWMLETIREFALERLGELAERDDVRDRHARFYVGLAEDVEPELRGPRQTELLDRLDQEQPNIRAALRRLSATDAVAQARLAGACWYFWYLRSHYREGRDELAAALDHAPVLPAAVEVRLHDGLVTLELCLGRDGTRAEAARTHAEASEALYGDLDRTEGNLRVLLNRSLASSAPGAASTAEAALDELIERARGTGNDWYLAVALGNRGGIALDAGDVERAHRLYSEALAVAAATGDDMVLASWEIVLAQVRLELGLLDEAAMGFAAGIERAHRLKLPESLFWGVEGVAALAALTDRPTRAAWLFGQADAMSAAMAYPLPWFFRQRRERVFELLGPRSPRRRWSRPGEPGSRRRLPRLSASRSPSVPRQEPSGTRSGGSRARRAGRRPGSRCEPRRPTARRATLPSS